MGDRSSIEWTCSGPCARTLPAESFAVDRSRARGRAYVCNEARRRVNYLVEQGCIPHPEDLPCMDCADEVFSTRSRHEYDHAKGYDGANQLYVEPVCSRCHHHREEARCG